MSNTIDTTGMTEQAIWCATARQILIDLGFDGKQYTSSEYTSDGGDTFNDQKSASVQMIIEWREKVAANWPQPLDLTDRRQKSLLRQAVALEIGSLWWEQAGPRYQFHKGKRVRVN